MAQEVNHQNNFATNLTSNTSAGVTTTPLNSIPTIDAPYYIALDATNINSKYEVVLVTSDTATNINHAATTYAHTTAEEVRMVVPAAELDEINDAVVSIASMPAANGWSPATGTWTYASATTITVPSGAASIYKKGDKIKLTQTTDKYFYVVTVADTLLTVTGGSDYTVANAAITSPYYSHQASPVGFPDSFSWAGAATGFSSTTVTNYKFSLNGTVCHIAVEIAGTSNSATHGLTLPIAALNSAPEIRVPIYIVDNGTAGTGRAEIQPGATSMPFAKDLSGGAFTSSGSCQTHVNLSYIIA